MVAVSLSAPSLPDVDGGMDLLAGKLRPSPSKAFGDRTTIYDDGCYHRLGEFTRGDCDYGDLDSDTTVVLFADSHGEPYFAALERLANRPNRGFHLVGQAKNFCSPARVTQRHPRAKGQFHDCHKWRQRTIGRARRSSPDLVVVAGSAFIRPVRKGKLLEGTSARKTLQRGFARTLRQLREGGARVALVTDVPKATMNVPRCARRNRNRLHRCNFRRPNKRPRALAKRAARKAGDAALVNTAGSVCRRKRCRGVVGNIIAYRDRGHLTATFGASLAGKFRRQLSVIR